MSDALYFAQLLAGRDFAAGDATAVMMRNFTYAIGDRASGRALLVDPAYDVEALVALVAAEGLVVEGAVATHYHPDHVGGRFLGREIEGVAELYARFGVPLHVHEAERTWVRDGTGLTDEAIITHPDGDVVRVGGVAVTLLHTPGHTPGSQCLYLEGRLLSGDTLFLEGCGRVDFPGGDPAAMAETLRRRFVPFGDDVVLYPGHLYSPEPSLTLGEVRRRNRGLLEVDAGATW